MSFTVEALNGYEKGKRYEQKLSCVRMFGNRSKQHIILRGEDGTQFLWATSGYTQVYKNFRNNVRYKFTVDHIMSRGTGSLPQINIRNLKLMEGGIING